MAELQQRPSCWNRAGWLPSCPISSGTLSKSGNLMYKGDDETTPGYAECMSLATESA